MQMAEEAGLDLVEISPNAAPPVCKIMDFGKFKYETQKREAEARKKQKIIEIKEVKFRPNTDINDYDVKMRNVYKFLENGDKVKMPTACEQLQNIVNCGLLPFDITCDEVCSELRLGAMCVRMPDKNKIAEVLHMNRTLDEKLGMVHADSKSAIEQWPMLDT